MPLIKLPNFLNRGYTHLIAIGVKQINFNVAKATIKKLLIRRLKATPIDAMTLPQCTIELQNVAVCDTREGESSNAAKYIISFSNYYGEIKLLSPTKQKTSRKD